MALSSRQVPQPWKKKEQAKKPPLSARLVFSSRVIMGTAAIIADSRFASRKRDLGLSMFNHILNGKLLLKKNLQQRTF